MVMMMEIGSTLFFISNLYAFLFLSSISIRFSSYISEHPFEKQGEKERRREIKSEGEAKIKKRGYGFCSFGWNMLLRV